MKNTSIQLVVALLVVVGFACAQEVPADRVCTDLSGKIRLACPHENKPEATPKSAEQPVPDRPNSNSPLQPVSATVANTPPSNAAGVVSGPSSTTSNPSPYPEPLAGNAQSTRPPASSVRDLPRNFVADQKNFWASPLRLRVQDASWLLPLAAGATVVVLSDGSIEKELPSSASFISHSKTFSDYGAAGYAGLVAGGYLWARATHNDHMRETAVLSGEAAMNSLLITEGIKYIAGRQRPLEGDGTGDFRKGGSSFTSMHAAGAWSIASVIAREYPGPLTQLLAYGGAAAISAARVTGRQHFTSDALIGSALGWYVGRQVYNAHKDHGNPDSLYGTFQRSAADRVSQDRAALASPYVPLDSWVYAAFDRLAARGAIKSAFLATRPWTRGECARLVQEIETEDAPDVERVRNSLAKEFAFELSGGQKQLAVESLYARFTGITGEPLTDGYHFTQTIANDYGRPYGKGSNLVAGISAYGAVDRFAFYVRGEYQRGAAAPVYDEGVRRAMAYADLGASGIVPAGSPDSASRFRLLDAYVALNFSSFQLSFGQQSASWGPTRSGGMVFSNNAPPITMIRLSRSSPFSLPGFLAKLGPIRTEAFWGELNGYQFVTTVDANGNFRRYSGLISPHPYIHGERFSLKPTPNLEIGLGVTTVFGGPGFPLTWRTLIRSYSISNTQPGRADDPGDRRSGFDFSYRVPGLRNWLVLYADSMAEDEFSPIAYPRRSAMNPGIYLPRMPGVPKLDFRFEGVYTDLPNLNASIFYHNDRFNSGYTNNGIVMGNVIGRDGRGLQGWSTYWLTPQATLQFGYREVHASPSFLQGGNLHDYVLRAAMPLGEQLTFRGDFQYERWKYPLLGPDAQTNVTAGFTVEFKPRWRIGR